MPTDTIGWFVIGAISLDTTLVLLAAVLLRTLMRLICWFRQEIVLIQCLLLVGVLTGLYRGYLGIYFYFYI